MKREYTKGTWDCDPKEERRIKLALPKGRLYGEVVRLLEDAGFQLSKNGRSYRPYINDPEIEVKIFKPQNIPKLIELGSQDLAFAGYDWVVEQGADVVELLDLEFNPVRIVAAIPEGKDITQSKNQKIRVASEYERISKEFLEKEGMNYVFINSFGATEVFIPEDADMIIDNTSTGKTLKENGLAVFKEILSSSTRLIAHKDSLQDPWKKRKIDNFLTLIRSILEGRKRLLIDMNVSKENLKKLIPVLPCMKSPTIAKLYGDQGYAVKIAIEKEKVGELIPLLKENGATDILVFKLEKVIP